MSVTITQIRNGGAHVAAALDGVGAPASSNRVSTARGGLARVLPNPALPASRPDATWLVPDRARLFGSSGLPTVRDIDKGTLGDCWFVAHAGSRAATMPSALGDMFEESAKHYVVHFPGDSVAVTKEIPYHEGVPAFGAHDWTPDGDTGLWLAVLEKAAAAREPGGYQALVGGHARWGFRLTTGVEPVRRMGGTPFDDALDALRHGHAPGIGMMPYEWATPGLPTIRMSTGQMQVLDGVAQYGNHYYVGSRVGSFHGEPTIEMFNSVLLKQPARGLTRHEFNSVVTHLDTPEWYTDYMRTGINQEAQHRLGVNSFTPAFPRARTDAERAAAEIRARDGHGG